MLDDPTAEPWWLGYLDTGSDDVVFRDAAPVRLNADWPYVLAEAGPEQALAWRSPATGRSLPDLLFPADHSWLLSTLWDDDWRCLGGPASLIEALQQDPDSRHVGYPSTRMRHLLLPLGDRVEPCFGEPPIGLERITAQEQSVLTLLPSTRWAAVAAPQRKPSGNHARRRASHAS